VHLIRAFFVVMQVEGSSNQRDEIFKRTPFSAITFSCSRSG
jgi:hypothetical protein